MKSKVLSRLLPLVVALAALAGCKQERPKAGFAVQAPLESKLTYPILLADFGVKTGSESKELWLALQAANDARNDLVCAPARVWARAMCKRAPSECQPPVR